MPEFIPEIPQNLADARELVRLIVYYGYQSSQDPPVYRPPLENAQQAGRTLINIRDVLYDYIDGLVISSSSSLFGKNDTKIWFFALELLGMLSVELVHVFLLLGFSLGFLLFRFLGYFFKGF